MRAFAICDLPLPLTDFDCSTSELNIEGNATLSLPFQAGPALRPRDFFGVVLGSSFP